MSDALTPFHLVIPAAGIGSRFAAELPKQYAEVADIPLIYHAINACLAVGCCESITVALAAEDSYWNEANLATSVSVPVQRVLGGAERSDSVLAALHALSARGVADSALVLVHDAARPYVPLNDMQALLGACENESGALLGSPVADTIKRVNNQSVSETIDRSELWRALTPQAFKLGLLTRALEHCLSSGIAVTDDASAVEALGFQPKIVQGSAANIKVTLPEDLAAVANYLSRKAV